MKNYLFLLSLAIAPIFFISCEQEEEETVVPAPVKQTRILSNVYADTTLVDIFEGDEVPDYFVEENIMVKATLTINPGVIIAVAANKGITVQDQGIMLANGGPTESIIFRGKTQEPGFWRGILITSEAGVQQLNNVEITHAGSSTLLSGKKAALALFGNNDTQLSLSHCFIYDNTGYGLYVEEGAELKEFSANSFSNNSQAGIISAADQVHRIDSNTAFASNGSSEIEVYSSAIRGEGELLWPAAHYHITGVNGLLVKGGWKIAPGALLEFADNTQLQVTSGDGNYMQAVGTADQKITFTAINKQKGAWKGISIYSKSDKNILEGTQISYGGSATLYGKHANLYVLFSNRLAVRNTSISHSPGYGIYLSETALINADFEQANEFEQNSQGSFFQEN